MDIMQYGSIFFTIPFTFAFTFGWYFLQYVKIKLFKYIDTIDDLILFYGLDISKVFPNSSIRMRVNIITSLCTMGSALYVYLHIIPGSDKHCSTHAVLLMVISYRAYMGFCLIIMIKSRFALLNDALKNLISVDEKMCIICAKVIPTFIKLDNVCTLHGLK